MRSFFVWERCTGGWRLVAGHQTRGSAENQLAAIRAAGGEAIVADQPPAETSAGPWTHLDADAAAERIDAERGEG